MGNTTIQRTELHKMIGALTNELRGAKAKGLAKYANECTAFSRIQMLRKIHIASGDKMLRLDMAKMSVRTKVMAYITEEDLDALFRKEGFIE